MDGKTYRTDKGDILYIVEDCENALSVKRTEVNLSRSLFYPLNLITVLCKGYIYVLLFTKAVQSDDHYILEYIAPSKE